MSNSVIMAENLSKLYRLGVFSTRMLTADLSRFLNRLIKKENDDYKIGEVNDRSLKKKFGLYLGIKRH